MKYVFQDKNTQVLSPIAGSVFLPNHAEIEYSFSPSRVYTTLNIDGCCFSNAEIDDLKELLTALQTQLTTENP
jgi:hypothetical protein